MFFPPGATPSATSGEEKRPRLSFLARAGGDGSEFVFSPTACLINPAVGEANMLAMLAACFQDPNMDKGEPAQTWIRSEPNRS